MLEQRCNHSKQCRNNVATRCCAKIVVAMSSKILRKHQFQLLLVFTTVTQREIKDIAYAKFWQNFGVHMRCVMENELMSSWTGFDIIVDAA